MKFSKTATLCFALTASISSVSADDQSPELTHNPTGCSLDWDGENNRSYFIQWSTALGNWTYFPTIRSGDGSLISHGFNCTASKFFLRLRWSDSPDDGDVNSADFDGDGFGNLVELQILGTDPLEADTDGNGILDGHEDSDLDGLPDGWELIHFGNLNAGASGNSDGDSYSNLKESKLGSDPTVRMQSGNSEDFAAKIKLYLPN